MSQDAETDVENKIYNCTQQRSTNYEGERYVGHTTIYLYVMDLYGVW